VEKIKTLIIYVDIWQIFICILEDDLYKDVYNWRPRLNILLDLIDSCSLAQSKKFPHHFTDKDYIQLRFGLLVCTSMEVCIRIMQ